MSLPLSEPVFLILRNLLEERFGLCYQANQREILADKISGRAMERGFESLLDYYYLLRYDPEGPAEMDALIEHLVVRETYFFRERTPLDVLCRELLVPAVRAGQRPRVWSAACATGEEPLTLAMLLASHGLLGKVDLIASDISQQALDRAQQGLFSPRAIRSDTPPAESTRWLQPHPPRGWRIDPALIQAVQWRRINLNDPTQIQAMGQFDVILCRNVLIYFSDAGTSAVIASLHQALRPTGVLVVGASESLLRFSSSFVCEERAGTFLYRKAES